MQGTEYKEIALGRDVMWSYIVCSQEIILAIMVEGRFVNDKVRKEGAAGFSVRYMYVPNKIEVVVEK